MARIQFNTSHLSPVIHHLSLVTRHFSLFTFRFSLVLLLCQFFCIPTFLFAQVDAGRDDTINPGVPVTLTAKYGQIGQGITFANEDGISGPYSIGFDFNFYGEGPYSQFWVGANGWISFVLNPASEGIRDAFNVPSAANYNPKACILGPFQDLDPTLTGGPYVFFKTLSTGNSKKLVVMWCQCPVVLCPDSTITFQIVLNEGINTIENFIYQKPSCSYEGTKKATQGIQNSMGSYGVVVPGNSGITIPSRNASIWSVPSNRPEGWRYTPTSADTYDVDTVYYRMEPITPGEKITYRWYEGSGTNPFSWDSTIVVTPNETTKYIVIATLCNGEQFKDSVTVNVIPKIPDAFTPNGDQVNETFKIIGLPAENIIKYNIKIYNRWGQIVFTSTDIREEWNGKMNNTGEICPDGTYVWVIYYEKGKGTKVTNKGTVTLLR